MHLCLEGCNLFQNTTTQTASFMDIWLAGRYGTANNDFSEVVNAIQVPDGDDIDNAKTEDCDIVF